MQPDVNLADPEPMLPPEDGRRSRDGGRDRWRRWGVCIQILVLLAVAAYAGVSYQQWRQLIVQSEYLNESLRAVQQAAGLLREANTRNQQLAEEALRAARESNETIQRAWMVFKGVEPTRISLAQQPMRLIIWLGNVGNSPAVRVSTASTLLVAKAFPVPPPYNATGPNISSPYPEVRSETVVGPKGDYGTYVILQNISPQVVDAINAGRINLYLHGRIEYFDQFKRPRNTTWCVVYLPKPSQDISFAACDVYNVID
jgi:hypothetical protein